jgi:copper(I)-binding protein
MVPTTSSAVAPAATPTPAPAIATPKKPTPPTSPALPGGVVPGAIVKAGSLVFSHYSLSMSADHIDLFMTIKNDGKADERLAGGGSRWDTGDIVQVTKQSGKEVETPIAVILPVGKTTEFAKGETWLRVKNVKQPKGETFFPVSFYFRSSPNANLNIPLKGGADDESGSVMDWLKK